MHFFFSPPVKEVPNLFWFFSYLVVIVSLLYFVLFYCFFFLFFFWLFVFLHQWGLIVPLAGQILFLPLFWPNPRG